MPERLPPPAKVILTDLRAALDHMPHDDTSGVPWVQVARQHGDRLDVLLDKLLDEFTIIAKRCDEAAIVMQAEHHDAAKAFRRIRDFALSRAGLGLWPSASRP